MSRASLLLRRSIGLGVGLWLGVATTDLVRGYVLNGHTWPAGDVLFYVNPANNDVSPDAAIAAIDQMATAWTAQSGASVRLVLAGTTSGSTIQNNGKNEVFFRNEASGNTIASTTYYYSSGRIVDADMKFYDGGFRFYTGTSGCSGAGMFLEDIAIHEFGHFIGIGHSTVATASMYPTISGCAQTARVLDSDDINAVRAAYPQTQLPATPYSAAAVPTGSNPSASVTLSWTDAANNESGFRVERSAGGSGFAVVATLSVNQTSWVNSGLSPATTYSYRLQAYNASGPSGYSNTASATTTSAPTAPPTTPANPSPANGATGVQPSAVSWSAVAGATSYDVFFGTATNPPLYVANVSSPSAGLSRLAAGTAYYWRVVAKNAAGSTSGPTWLFTTKTRGKPN